MALKKWKSFQEFIDFANQKCNWIVLRNFEYLPDNFFENDKDVDVLCENISKFIDIMGLEKRSWGIAAYQGVIDNKIVFFDIRFLGDGYYDKLWQYKMLNNKIFTDEKVPRLNDEDYFYSLIYHSKIQKREIKNIYVERLFELAKKLKIKNYQKNAIFNNEYIANLLSEYMKKKHYLYELPVDINVIKNQKFIKLLQKDVREKLVYNPPIYVYILNLIPPFFFKLFSRKFKNLLKKKLFK